MPTIGFLPAAGRGVRFGATGYAKEIFPLLTTGDKLELRPVADLALSAIASAGADRCVVMISPEKTDLVRVLGAGARLSLAYLVQPEPVGLPDAILRARPWLEGADVLFALPDTVVLPADALARLQEQRRASGADLVLGVFPVDDPERLGPVDLAPDGTVRAIHDKPSFRTFMNTWGMASWGPRFTAFCADWEQAQRGQQQERVIGHVFEAARAAGLNVGALFFADGLFLDIGTPTGLRAALVVLVEKGILDAAQISSLPVR